MPSRRVILRQLMTSAGWAALAGLSLPAHLLAQAEARPKGRRIALLVGVNEYDNKTQIAALKYAVRDVEEFRKELELAGFDEIRMLVSGKSGTNEPTAENIRTALEELLGLKAPPGQPKARVTGEDLLVVGMAGHGMQPIGSVENYFLPANANTAVEVTANGNQIPRHPDTLLGLSQMLKTIGTSNIGKHLVLIDACRNRPEQTRNISAIPAAAVPLGGAVLLSCKPGQVAREDSQFDGGHGAFFCSVLRGLRGAAIDDRQEVTWDSLQTYVKRQTRDLVDDTVGEGAIQEPNHLTNSADIVVLLDRDTLKDLGRIAERPGTPPPPPPPPPGVKQLFQMDLTGLSPGQPPKGWTSPDAIGMREFSEDFVPRVLGPTARTQQTIQLPPLDFAGEFCLNMEILSARGGVLELQLSDPNDADPIRFLVDTQAVRRGWSGNTQVKLPNGTQVGRKTSWGRILVTLRYYQGQVQAFVDGRHLGSLPKQKFNLKNLTLLFNRAEGLGISRLVIETVVRNQPAAQPIQPVVLKPLKTGQIKEAVRDSYANLQWRGDFELVLPLNPVGPRRDPGYWTFLTLCGRQGAMDLPVAVSWDNGTYAARIRGEEASRNYKQPPASLTLRREGALLSLFVGSDLLLASRLDDDPQVGVYDELLVDHAVKTPLQALQLRPIRPQPNPQPAAQGAIVNPPPRKPAPARTNR